jgi:N6-L-threonylcarbamoyladenine synthase
MIVLGIESSCDETACALVEDGSKVLSSCISSQIAIHQPFGGIVPEIASREHLSCITTLANEALSLANLNWQSIDAIAVTQGPGLVGALLVGISFAKGLALSLDRPLIPVDHIHAHIAGAHLGLHQDPAELYPAIALVVSGGHTNLYAMRHSLDFRLIGYSQDDACGECFDKVGKILGFTYPGGPKIEKLAKGGRPTAHPMPRMMEGAENGYMFSYSGLKTHMVNLIRRQKVDLSPSDLADVCASFQNAAFSQISRKIALAIQEFQPRSVIIAGGVSANQAFREKLQEEIALPIYCPQLQYCGDNAAMIAAVGYQILTSKLPSAKHPSPINAAMVGKDARGKFDWDAYPKYHFQG